MFDAHLLLSTSLSVAHRMAARFPLLTTCSTKCLIQKTHPPIHPTPLRSLPLYPSNNIARMRPASMKARSCKADDDKDDGPTLMTDAEREEWRRKIWDVTDTNPDIEEETDPERKKMMLQKLLADYPLVVEEEDPDWPEDADGRGFNFDQFFNKVTIKNVKREADDDEEEEGGYASDKEIVWQDDDYIRPVRDVTAGEWEDTVFKDFNPLVILVHNRYKRPRENEKAREELERAVQTFWEAGMPSPRCVAVDAVVEEDIVSALRVSAFPEILFTKAGKILHRDKGVRTADEWSKIMAFFYYRAVRPPCLDESAGQNEEKIPFIFHIEG